MVDQALQSENTIVRLHDNVCYLVVGKDRVGLDELLGIPVIQPFKEV
jgi:hypothetical protein